MTFKIEKVLLHPDKNISPKALQDSKFFRQWIVGRWCRTLQNNENHLSLSSFYLRWQVKNGFSREIVFVDSSISIVVECKIESFFCIVISTRYQQLTYEMFGDWVCHKKIRLSHAIYSTCLPLKFQLLYVPAHFGKPLLLCSLELL